ncbi:MAG: cobalamin biosynthesis protein CobW, partial [Clostridiales bacterium]|nr:cobalamin biosynthesis protein CobW [Clostridiales bacterium]
MILIDIFSGFLGAGKTTLIKKLIKEAYTNEKVVLIENEFGEIGVDGGFMQDAGIEITEMNSGCICCSLVGDFAEALKRVADEYSPDRIIIEPSGVGKLSDVIKAVERAGVEHSKLNAFCTVVDAKKCKIYLKNFGEFFLDQVEHASCIVLSHNADAAKANEAAKLLKEHTNATIITTEWDKLSGKEILLAMQQTDSLQEELKKLSEHVEHHHGCCHHDHDEEEEHHHGCCHHDHDEEEKHHHGCCHHDHDEHEHHHHEHGHGHHHADEVFSTWGVETAQKFTKEKIEAALKELDSGKYGQILR